MALPSSNVVHTRDFRWFKWHPSPRNQDHTQQDIDLAKGSQGGPRYREEAATPPASSNCRNVR